MNMSEVRKIEECLNLEEKNALALYAYLLDLFEDNIITMFHCSKEEVEVGYKKINDDIKDFIDFVKNELNLDVKFDEEDKLFYIKTIEYDF